MTEQEAEAWGARMTRIWSIVAPSVVKTVDHWLNLIALVSEDVELRVSVRASGTDDFRQCSLHEIGPNLSFLYCNNLEMQQTLLSHDWGKFLPNIYAIGKTNGCLSSVVVAGFWAFPSEPLPMRKPSGYRALATRRSKPRI